MDQHDLHRMADDGCPHDGPAVPIFGSLDSYKYLEQVESSCNHGVTFDPAAAAKMSPREVVKNFPRLSGECPKGCGFIGIVYASYEHYLAGDW